MARAVGSSEAPVDIIGWSLGGLVAQELCCVAPSEVRRAVLASTSPGGDISSELISRDFFDVFDGWSEDDTREGEIERRRAAAAAFVPASAQPETVADGAIISANCATGVALAQQAVKIAGRVAAERAAATAVLEATKNLTGLTQKSAELCKEQEQRQSMYSQNQ